MENNHATENATATRAASSGASARSSSAASAANRSSEPIWIQTLYDPSPITVCSPVLTTLHGVASETILLALSTWPREWGPASQ
ncbi:hypothetical protein Hesp01_46030 [Herbidospora sp. NBRC 101105]|nr:hypothetical protein Hesp01_46030 [Herbidospora sp. NBRC 101105]